MQPLSIAMVVPSLATIGGSVRVASSLANYCAEQGHLVTMISRASYERIQFELDPTIQCLSLDIDASLRLRHMVQAAYKPLKQLFSERKFDLVLGIGTYDSLLALAPARRTKTKLVFCDHGALINQFSDKKMRLMSYLDMKFSAATVTLTQRSKEDYHRLLAAPLQKLWAIPNWISDELLHQAEGVSYETAEKKILWCGRLDTEKGVDHLLDIAEKVLPDYPDWSWDVYGEPYLSGDLEEIQREVARRGLSGRLNLRGRCDEMYAQYKHYAIVSLTSYREGLPLVLLEGLAFLRPLISFDVQTGPSEIIEPGKNGYLVSCYDCDEYAEKLKSLMDNDELRRSMSSNAVEIRRRFLQANIAKLWDSLFAALSPVHKERSC